MEDIAKEKYIKKILYRSNNRGSKETDIILGKFAEASLVNLSDEELTDFVKFLDESDMDIFNWVTGKQELPSKYKKSFFEKLVNYNLKRK